MVLTRFDYESVCRCAKCLEIVNSIYGNVCVWLNIFRDSFKNAFGLSTVQETKNGT